MSHGRCPVGGLDGEDDGDGDGEPGPGEDGVGDPVTPPVHVTPLSAKLVGAWFEPVHVPLNPKPALPPVGMLAL